MSNKPIQICLIFLFCFNVNGQSGRLLEEGSGDSTRPPYKLTGENVCRKMERIAKEITVPVRRAIEVQESSFCLKLTSFRCTKTKTIHRIHYEKKVEYVDRKVDVCCSGYVEAGGKCIAFCQRACIHGQCVAPDRCECQEGFTGEQCESNCPSGFFGDQCQEKCLCHNGATCDANSGECKCAAGWRGLNCSEPCPETQYGHLCLGICRCKNGARCDHVSGACKCASGFCGPLCESIECPLQVGEECDKCQNGGRCMADGVCDCPAGWKGEVCANECEGNKWGKNCTEICPTCYNGGQCNRTTGVCSCPPGYSGVQCQLQCSPGFYGKNCMEKCECQNGAKCDVRSGKCQCTEGFSGKLCENRVCPDNFYDPASNCEKNCECGNGTNCHPISGACTCNSNWRDIKGRDCCTCCILNGEEENCLRSCQCHAQKFICEASLGGCVCMPWYKGTTKECAKLILQSRDEAEGTNAIALSSKSDSTRTAVVVGVLISIFSLLMLFVILLFLYKRRRKAKYAESESSPTVSFHRGSPYNLSINSSSPSGPNIVTNPMADDFSFTNSSTYLASNVSTASDNFSVSPSLATTVTVPPPSNQMNNNTANASKPLPRKITNIERSKLGPLAEELSSASADIKPAVAKNININEYSSASNKTNDDYYEDFEEDLNDSVFSRDIIPPAYLAERELPPPPIAQGPSRGTTLNSHSYASVEEMEKDMRLMDKDLKIMKADVNASEELYEEPRSIGGFSNPSYQVSSNEASKKDGTLTTFIQDEWNRRAADDSSGFEDNFVPEKL